MKLNAEQDDEENEEDNTDEQHQCPGTSDTEMEHLLERMIQQAAHKNWYGNIFVNIFKRRSTRDKRGQVEYTV